MLFQISIISIKILPPETDQFYKAKIITVGYVWDAPRDFSSIYKGAIMTMLLRPSLEYL